MKRSALQPCSPFTGLLVPTPGLGVITTARDSLSIARVAARKAGLNGLVQRVRERFGIELPQGPRRVEVDGVAFVGVGVETWLATAEDAAAEGLASSLKQVCGDLASVTDQNGTYGVLRLSGGNVRDALAKFVPIDLHDREFTAGAAAATAAAHVAITLWRLDDGADGSRVYELAVPRSYAASLWHILTESSAEFGFTFNAS